MMICEDYSVALCMRCWRVFYIKEVFKTKDYYKIVSENNYVTIKLMVLYL